MKDIDEALDYLYSFINYENNNTFKYNSTSYNVERTKYLLNKVGNPEKDLNIIHVAGTKGKGSVCMIINGLLREQGYNTGLFLSPHIERVNERIVANDREIDNKSFINLLNNLKVIIDKLPEGKIPTTFEILTVMAILYFKEKGVDFAILETGMGGRLDSTNFCTPLISIITSISYDHMDKLGDTIKKIAKEKAGIIKKNIPVVVGLQKYNVYSVFSEVAKKENSNIYSVKELCSYSTINTDEKGSVFDIDIDGIRINNIFTPLYGRHQIENIALAMLSLKVLNLLPDEKSIKNRISRLHFKTRFEKIKKMGRIFILDSAHNEDSAKRLSEAIKDHFPGKNVISLIGIVKGKDIKGIIKHIAPLSNRLIITNPITHKELDISYVFKIAKLYKKDSLLIDDIHEAFKKAIDLTTESDIILITGSFYTTSPARELIKKL